MKTSNKNSRFPIPAWNLLPLALCLLSLPAQGQTRPDATLPQDANPWQAESVTLEGAPEPSFEPYPEEWQNEGASAWEDQTPSTSNLDFNDPPEEEVLAWWWPPSTYSYIYSWW
ncbi:MAG: hypothetical protein SWY16_14385 [Cyanobacteriota bacterium]|nr:hypothetical protein [Cyanobacteriota bacterium]